MFILLILDSRSQSAPCCSCLNLNPKMNMYNSQLLLAGFAFNFANVDGIWGSGTYYSSKPWLAIRYEHRLQPQDEFVGKYLGDVGNTIGASFSACCLALSWSAGCHAVTLVQCLHSRSSAECCACCWQTGKGLQASLLVVCLRCQTSIALWI